MRIARCDDEVREGYKLSRSEALSSFGDDRMLIEVGSDVLSLLFLPFIYQTSTLLITSDTLTIRIT